MRVLILILAWLSIGVVQAQEPDTLDPRGYFPLAVGNEWEYRYDRYRPASPWRPEDQSQTFYERYAVIADSLDGDVERFALLYERLSEEGIIQIQDTSVVWFDTTASVVRTSGENQDEAEVYPWFACRMDISAFNEYRCWTHSYLDVVYRQDLFGESNGIESRVFEHIGGLFAETIHGFGFVSIYLYRDGCDMWCDNDDFTLTFAQVDGVTYGAHAVASEPPPSLPNRALAVYPNPTQGAVTVRTEPLSQPTPVEVYDGLGRRILSSVLPTDGIGTVDLSGLPSGLYVIRVGQRTGQVVVR